MLLRWGVVIDAGDWVYNITDLVKQGAVRFSFNKPSAIVVAEPLLYSTVNGSDKIKTVLPGEWSKVLKIGISGITWLLWGHVGYKRHDDDAISNQKKKTGE